MVIEFGINLLSINFADVHIALSAKKLLAFVVVVEMHFQSLQRLL